jgi:peptide/nickel transport system substrate-binding protein
LDVPPVGSGPYKFVEYKKGEYLKYEANDSYYGGQPKEKNILLQIISNPDTAKVALQKGEVDAV